LSTLFSNKESERRGSFEVVRGSLTVGRAGKKVNKELSLRMETAGVGGLDRVVICGRKLDRSG
jgi:hypothetical protein